MKIKAQYKSLKRDYKCIVTFEDKRLYDIDFNFRQVFNDYVPLDNKVFSIEKVLSKDEYFGEYNYFIEYTGRNSHKNMLFLNLSKCDYYKLKYISGKSFLNDKILIKEFIFMIIGIVLGWLISK